MPFWREQGQGEAVVCLHSNASSSAQWRALGELIADRFRVFAVDGYGSGRSPDWPADVPARFDEEVRLLEPVFERAGDAIHLVGHSYGGAVALLAAAGLGDRLRSVSVYEPTLFSLVAAGDPIRSPAAGIWHAATDATALHEQGDADAAAARFVDFWSGDGAWAAMPEARRPAVREAIRHVGRWREATFAPLPSPDAVTALDRPVLLMWGERTPQSALSVAQRLAATLPRVTCESFAALGHMGPLVDPGPVNARIAAFLDLHGSPAAGNARAAVADPPRSDPP